MTEVVLFDFSMQRLGCELKASLLGQAAQGA